MGAARPDDGAVLEAVAAGRAEIEALLEDLVRARTLLGAEAAGQEVMRRAFSGLGLDPVDVPLDPAALARQPGGVAVQLGGRRQGERDSPPGRRTGAGRSLILNGHIDVVSPEPSSLWSSDPFEPRRDGEWMYGRGAGDMKAGLAAIVGAVAGLRRLGHEPGGLVELQSVVEEECTGNGAAACVLAGSRADAAVLTEPTGGAIWNAQVGVLWFSVRVAGRPAHAGEAASGDERDRGDGARDRRAARARGGAERVAAAAVRGPPAPDQPQRRHDPRRRLAVDRRGRVRRRDAPGALPRRGRGRPARAASRRPSPPRPRPTRSSPRCTVEVRYDGFACEGYVLERDPVIDAVGAAAARVYGAAPPLFASTATTDARTFHLYGATPAICFGPYAERIHSVDERVHLPSVVQTAQALALLIRDWCG